MVFSLKRVAYTKDGTFGVLLFGNTPFAVTLERPWLGNRRNVSCIPEGEYTARRCRKSAEYHWKDSPKFGDTFVVQDVPGRSHILFHKGNLDDDTHGCILIGEQFGVLGDSAGILQSGAGFAEFKMLTAELDDFAFHITSA